MKPSIVVISDEDDDNEPNSDEESEEELESENDSVYSDSDDPEYDDESDVENSDEEECFDDFTDNGVRLRQGSNDLPELSLNECKEYLRKHQLRLSGTKEECIQRIKEHGRLKDGRGELLYPRSSFSINCTGDACKGDVVLFRQKACKKRGNKVGKRTVAGRIVKESYGTSKQQHTFTVEVLWSKPFKSLPPLSTLLVKGRNLYRFGTYRQAWKNEAERLKVLGEKHTRGDAARYTRKRRQTEFASNNDKGGKRQKLSNGGPSQTKNQTRSDKHKSAKRRGAAPVTKNIAAHNKAQKTKFKTSKQPTFHGASSSSSSVPYDRTPLPNLASSSFVSYDRTSLPNLPHVGFSSYGLYNGEQPRLSNVLARPPGYHHYNYGQPGPRHRFG
ncbi:putative transcription regulator SAP family [Helianthus debilis subsp. tardiflorus]